MASEKNGIKLDHRTIWLYYYERRKSWLLRRGNDALYDADRILVEFDTKEQAKKWCKKELGVVVDGQEIHR